VFENDLLRRIFIPRKEEVAGEWRKLCNVEVHNLYSSPVVTRMTKSRLKCVGCEMHTKV
jgi:hypothetical protein